jgi:hypothetical protein
MEKLRNPAHCKHHPLCEPIKTLVSSLSLTPLDTHTGLLPKDAESICSQCNEFERREMLNMIPSL